ncbi:Bug family tripartite tricarboxylate transporter substrate binding protein [Ramlibacter sp. AW1]|uniref:Bug family tripartite tricarboxylate transporter substrate binding protein n=1 Tax=Ramlibacter aurantiacus TaxID=2801330 RepID=A0A936ZCG8_9BURK|nr:Bug family tripartite tricarboxylate transporter substrate binding protein [Ramlibacter aurantiacus]MBL0419064.1 Bug family tripartite tricarboxylate transporter substrate binding protein [Ramlibacter aurantiacus]
MHRRDFIKGACGAASLALPGWALAQNDRPLRILVGFAAGVSIDVVARIVGDKLKDELKRPVLIDNRAGAGGRLAAELLKSAPPDGNTLMITPVVVPVLAPMVFNKLNYNPQTDFAPVVRLCDFGFALAVSPGTPARTLKEYVAWLQANPQKATFGSPAAGSLPHFFGEMIGHALKVDMIHAPYNGGAALQSAVLGDHVPAGIDVVMEWQQNARAGKVKVLATSGAARSPVMPDVPTFREQGYPDIVGQGWFGMYAPARTPQEQIDAVNRAVNKVLALPEVRERFAALGLEPGGGTAADLGRTMQEDAKRWGPVVKRSGFRVD